MLLQTGCLEFSLSMTSPTPEVGVTALGKGLPHPQTFRKLRHVYLLANVSVSENSGEQSGEQ